MSRGERQRTGLAGEHFVVSELLQRGWHAALTHGNTERVDVLAEFPVSGQLLSLQVKTKKTKGAWRMSGPADRSRKGGNEWFAFVDLAVDQEERPICYLVPRDHVAALGSAQEHLNEKSGGRFVNHSDIARYRNEWELLEKPALRVKPRFDEWVSDYSTML